MDYRVRDVFYWTQIVVNFGTQDTNIGTDGKKKYIMLFFKRGRLLE